MPVAYFDPIGGAAGDMFLGALIDAGLEVEDLRRELDTVALSGYYLNVRKVQKQQIAATQFTVEIEGGNRHVHDHTHDRGDHGRSLREILELIERSALRQTVKDRAATIFTRLGEAEAKVHGVPFAEVHFHEVGAIDSIVDIVGAAIAVELLKLDAVYCGPLPLGQGTIRTRHGLYPIPAPATLELVARAGAPVLPSAVDAEQVTPTGAAILATIARFGRPAMTPRRVGYGSGESDLPIPNVLRVWLGETLDGHQQMLTVLECNIDDMNPQLFGPAVEKLFEAGALDAWLVPVIMKKGRPGTQIGVMCETSLADRLREVLLLETSTLGVRSHDVQRYAAPREMQTVQTAFGPVAVKVKRLGGRAVSASPEFEDCRRLSISTGAPLPEVYQAAVAAGRALLRQES